MAGCEIFCRDRLQKFENHRDRGIDVQAHLSIYIGIRQNRGGYSARSVVLGLGILILYLFSGVTPTWPAVHQPGAHSAALRPSGCHGGWRGNV